MDYCQLRQLLPKSCAKWTQEDVGIWLKFLQLSKWASAFRNLALDAEAKNMDGQGTLKITEKILREEIGMDSNISVKKILNCKV